MNTDIKNYFDNTKFICITITISLLLIIFSIIMPLNIYKPLLIIIKLFIIYILMIALYKNTIETNNLINNIDDIFKDPSLSSIKNNMIISYILSFVIFVLVLYIIKSLFY
jgi:hypothetical protein